MPYQQRIREAAAAQGHVGANPAHIEAWMRCEHATLDGLSAAQFSAEVASALACMQSCGDEQNDALALSFGLAVRS